MRKTAEQACIDYALAVADKRKYHAIICAPTCIHILEWDRTMPDTPRPDTCLDEFFTAPKGPDGEFPRHNEFFAKLCDPCKGKLGALTLRADAGRRIGAARRSIGAIGKRLSHPADDSVPVSENLMDR